MGQWVTTNVLGSENAKNREKILRHFLQIAHVVLNFFEPNGAPGMQGNW